MTYTFNPASFDLALYDRILARGLSTGIGKAGGQVCIEAALCEALGLPHDDDPGCVTDSVRSFKIHLNDSSMWNSPTSRAAGMRDVGLAQLGSKGVVDSTEFSKRLAEKTIRVLIPKLFRELAYGSSSWLTAADRCEKEGTASAAASASHAASRIAHAANHDAAYAAHAAHRAAFYIAASANHAAGSADHAAAYAAAYAALATRSESYLVLSASLALEVLRELNSPGVALLSITSSGTPPLFSPSLTR